MLNLYIFNETRRGAVYGVGTYIRELTTALRNSDIHVNVVNLFSEKTHIQTEEINNIMYWYFPEPISKQSIYDIQKLRDTYFRNIVYLLQLRIQNKNNLIFHLNFLQNGSLVEELKNAFDCRVVSVIHFTDWGFTFYDNLPRLRNILNEEQSDSFGEDVKKAFEEEKAYYSKVDHIICLSNYMQDILCKDYGIDATKISVISNGLEDYGELSDKDALRKKWNIPYGEKVILFAGRIDEVKGVIYLIRAFREVLKKQPNCRLIIIGSGNYDICFQEAKDICTKITFTGLLDKKDLNEIYQIADAGVVPSLFEPFGYVAVEMIMHELPVVATATSGLNEVVNNACGLKIPLTILSESVEIDVTLLSEKIAYLLQHPIEAGLMGQNGRKRYLDNYSLEIFRINMVKTYNSLFQ